MKKKDKNQIKWIEENEEVRNWILSLENRSMNTAKGRRYQLYHYWKWLFENKGIQSTNQLFIHYRNSKRHEREYEHIDWLKEYILSVGKSKSYSWREGCLSTVREFYRFNRCPLPDERIELTVRETDANNLRERASLTQMTLDDFRKLTEPAKIREKSALLIMVQSGMGVGEFCNQFNVCTCTKEMVSKQGHTCVPVNVIKQLKENKSLIKIYPLIAFKQRNLNDSRSVFFTFIGKDGIDALKRYLVFRRQLVQNSIKTLHELEERNRKHQHVRKWEKRRYNILKERLQKITVDMNPGEPIFITNTLTPVRSHIVQQIVRTLKKQTGLSNRAFTPHTCRDLFKTACSHTGVSDQVSEYWIRHRLDSYGYNQLDRLYPEDFEKEYRKVEGELNILSKAQPTNLDETRQVILEVIDGMLEDPKKREVFMKRLVEALHKTDEESEFSTEQMKRVS